MRAITRVVGVGLAVGAMTGCDAVDQALSNQPDVVPTTQAIEVAPAPTPPPVASNRFIPFVQADGSVRGASAVYDYPGVSIEQVSAMEHCGNDTNKVVLTFDDEGSPDHIRQIASTLKAYNAGAIFFPNSGFVDQGMFDELRGQGFWVGNHTATHPNLHKMESDGEIAAAIDSGGGSDLFRPPYGASMSKNGEVYFDGRVKAVAESMGRRICTWTVDTKDWDGLSAQEVQQNALATVTDGSVILMHMQDGYGTLEALPGIIEGIRAKGLEVCALQPAPTTREIPVSLPC